MFKKLLFFGIVLTMMSCEKESLTETTSNSNLTQSSLLTGLLKRIAQNPSAFDNVLDGCSGFSVVLPVTVTVNGSTITVASESDFQTVQNIKNAYPNDTDEVFFTYPIQLRLKNHQLVTVTSYNQFEDLYEDYSSDDLTEIRCVNMQFPITINTYNTSSQQTQAYTLTNDVSLYQFLTSLTANLQYSLSYPLTVIDANNNPQAITSNVGFESVIDANLSQCDVPVGNTPLSFTTLLTDNIWYVSSYIDDDGSDDTDDFEDYTFDFLSNFDIQVFEGSLFANGSWNYYTTGNTQKLNLNFSNSNLQDLDQDWTIVEYTNGVIRLRYIDSDNDVEYLVLRKL